MILPCGTVFDYKMKSSHSLPVATARGVEGLVALVHFNTLQVLDYLSAEFRGIGA